MFQVHTYVNKQTGRLKLCNEQSHEKEETDRLWTVLLIHTNTKKAMANNGAKAMVVVLLDIEKVYDMLELHTMRLEEGLLTGLGTFNATGQQR